MVARRAIADRFGRLCALHGYDEEAARETDQDNWMVNREQPNDEGVMALLEEHAAERGATVAVERVDGQWRAGFVLPDDLGEKVIVSSVHGPDRSAALRQLLGRTADALEKTADLGEQHAEWLESVGRSGDAARERGAAERAREAAQRARLNAKE